MVRDLLIFALMLLTAASPLLAESARILVDGLFSDWEYLDPVYTDPGGDQTSGDIDFGRLWIANDENWLHVCLEVGGEINLQGDNRITIFLDTDNDAATGQQWHGIGAELGWTFGNRIGFFVAETFSFDIRHDRIGLVSAPTFTGTRFEFAFEIDATPVGPYPLFQGDTIGVVIADSEGGDVIPDVGESVVYAFDDTPLVPVVPVSLRKRDESQVRFLTYNVLFDGIFDPDKRRSFDRILNAIGPDIIGFQEIYNHSAEETRDLVAGMLPWKGEWYGSKAGPDIITVSNYPITGTYPIGANGAFLIDLGDEYNSEVLFVVAHPPCCDNDEGRQVEVDAMMAFVRDAKSGAGALDLPAGTPIVILGDMNFVGDRRQLNTVLTGEIVNTGTYGAWFRPDWDETDLADVRPLHTNSPLTMTWRDEASSYWPGRLDFVVYTDAVLDIGNNFVLSTGEMHEDTLAAYGLLESDTAVASDHLPVVSDFTIEPAGHIPPPETYVSPNPARHGTTAIVFGERFVGTSKQVAYYDVMGKRVRQESAGPGDINLLWDGRNADGHTVAPGIYFAVIENASVQETVKIVYLR